MKFRITRYEGCSAPDGGRHLGCPVEDGEKIHRFHTSRLAKGLRPAIEVWASGYRQLSAALWTEYDQTVELEVMLGRSADTYDEMELAWLALVELAAQCRTKGEWWHALQADLADGLAGVRQRAKDEAYRASQAGQPDAA